MPRVKTLLGEIGTTGTVERFEVSGNAADDIGRAVELEHPCSDDAACDIAAALRAGCPYSAAHLLAGATETPLLDTVCEFYGFNPSSDDNPEDWQEWVEFFKEYGRQCPSCHAFNFADEFEPDTCGNCLGTLPPRPNEDADAFISEVRGGYSVSVEGSFLGSFDSFELACGVLWQWTEGHGFYPETWFVNERGNTELLSRTDNPHEPYSHAGVGYV